ncbi:MAG: putative sulfate exporter family transporter [Pseudonocardiaceae bacterium]
MIASTQESAVRPAPVEASHWLPRIAPGLLVALALAGIATLLGQLVPIVGGPVFGILAGALSAAALPALRAPRWQPGYTVAAKPILQLSIVVLGTGLTLRQVVSVGGQSLPVMLGTLAVALSGAWVLGRLLTVRGDTLTLIAVGTAICGASAIAATTAVIKAKDCAVAYAIGTIFTFNIAAVLLFPLIGHLLGMNAHAFGLWSGTAINDTSSVLAAGYAYGGDAGAYSLVVKLTRTLALVPIVIMLGISAARRDTANSKLNLRAMPWRKIVPLFLLGFILAAGLDSSGSPWRPAVWAYKLSPRDG